MAIINDLINRLTATNAPAIIIDLTMTALFGLLFGLVIALIYKYTTPPSRFSLEYAMTLLIICGVISVIISVIGTNLARAFSLAGALSIIRFRSIAQAPRDIAYIFFAMGTGLACGAGLYIPAAMFIILMGIALIVYNVIKNNSRSEVRMIKICIPESLNFDGLFDDVLGKYSSDYSISLIRSMSGGTVYELTYYVKLLDTRLIKDLLDEIRVKNANFNVTCLLPADLTE